MLRCLTLLTCALLLACADDAECLCDAEPSEGRAIYESPAPDGNTFACATCHALSEPAPDGLRRVAHPLGDAAGRPSYKGGAVAELREAVNSCLVEWMTAAPLSASDERWLALEAFLEAEANGQPAEPIALRITPPPADLSGGDGARGRALFDETCASCHGAGAGGTELAPALVGMHLPEAYVAERVRLSGQRDSSVYEGLTGGRMPFWSADRLSDPELRDLIAFLSHQGDAVAVGGDGDDAGGSADAGGSGGSGGSGGGEPSGCASTHPRVGVRGTFGVEGSVFHQVAGSALVVDDCTIRLENFSYDGGGIDVRIYGGSAGVFGEPTGFAMSDDLLGMSFDDGTLTVTLPPGKTLDDLDAVSVWCVNVGQDFGHANLPLP